MWIELTDYDGNSIVFNQAHIVSVRAHGTGTLVTHIAGQSIVTEDLARVRQALNLRGLTSLAGQHWPRTELN